MSHQPNPDSKEHPGEYHAPWEKSFARILTPFEEFIHRQTTSGLLLMGMAVLALVLANGPLASGYEHLLHTYASIGVGSWQLDMISAVSARPCPILLLRYSCGTP